ncbi:MAG: hypothetical protein Q9222_000726 [Ikaeria aurantiellina]
MSTPPPGESAGAEEDRKGFSKFVRRASKVFRRRSSARQSISGPSGVTQPSTETTPAEPTAGVVTSPPPIAETAVESQPTTSSPAPSTTQQPAEGTTAKPPNPRLAVTAAASSAALEEKARALFAKYGLTLEPGEWTTPMKPDAERVEKRIRMRVHRTCHYCQSMFGPDKVCGNCKHSRCKKCPRYPKKRTKESKEKDIMTGGAAAASTDDTILNLKSLTISSRATGKQISYKPATQRVRRTCHKPKTAKYPAGYPGDSGSNVAIRERHPIRTHVRWTCHECSKVFQDLSRKCEGCGHERCDDCPRRPPKRQKAKPDPDALRMVEERLKTMEMSPQASAA